MLRTTCIHVCACAFPVNVQELAYPLTEISEYFLTLKQTDEMEGGCAHT